MNARDFFWGVGGLIELVARLGAGKSGIWVKLKRLKLKS